MPPRPVTPQKSPWVRSVRAQQTQQRHRHDDGVPAGCRENFWQWPLAAGWFSGSTLSESCAVSFLWIAIATPAAPVRSPSLMFNVASVSLLRYVDPSSSFVSDRTTKSGLRSSTNYVSSCHTRVRPLTSQQSPFSVGNALADSPCVLCLFIVVCWACAVSSFGCPCASPKLNEANDLVCVTVNHHDLPNPTKRPFY